MEAGVCWVRGREIIDIFRNHFALRELLKHLPEFFLERVFVWARFGVVFPRRACYRRVSCFPIPVDSPRDKREESCFRNRGLRFGIRADNRRFPIGEGGTLGSGQTDFGDPSRSQCTVTALAQAILTRSSTLRRRTILALFVLGSEKVPILLPRNQC